MMLQAKSRQPITQPQQEMKVRVMPGAEEGATLSHQPFHVLNEFRVQLQSLGVFTGEIDLMGGGVAGQRNRAKVLAGNHWTINEAAQTDRFEFDLLGRLSSGFQTRTVFPSGRQAHSGC